MADVVEIFLLLRNARKFVEDANKSSTAVSKIGTEAEKSGKKAGIGWKGMAKWAGGATALYGATRYIKGAVSATTSLAKSTMAVQRVTSMDTQTASAWVGVLKERHVTTQTFGRTLATLSKEMERSRIGSLTQRQTMAALNKEYAATVAVGGKKAPAALAKLTRQMDAARAKGDKARQTLSELGVSARDITKGNTQGVILSISDSFQKMQNPAQRAAIAQKLFGRSAQALLPLLVKGREGVEDALGTMVKYGNVISGKGRDAAYKFIRDQRDLKAATEGLRVTLGVALMPAILSVTKVIMKLTDVFQPLLRTGWLVKSMLGVLVVAFIAYKAAIVVATIASWGLTAAQWASIGIWVLVIGALIAVGVAVVVLYKKWGWFHHAIDMLWGAIKVGFEWVKKNWPLLLGILTGPFGLAAVLIIKHFDKVKRIVLGIIDAIKGAITGLISRVKSIPGSVLDRVPGMGIAKGIGGKVAGLFAGASGGVVPYHSNVLVGERGPEMLTLPGGSTVKPLPQSGSINAGGAFGTAHITTQVVLDRRVVAEAVAQYAGDKIARR